jgi:hypothetical protein
MTRWLHIELLFMVALMGRCGLAGVSVLGRAVGRVGREVRSRVGREWR